MPNLRSKTWTSTTPATADNPQFWEDHLISDAHDTQIDTNTADIADIKAEGSGHTIVDPDGTDLSKEKKLQFAGDVTVSDDSTNGKTVVTIAGAGHTVQDASGTALAQERILQFKGTGLTSVADDSANGKTVVTVSGEKGDTGNSATIAVGTVTTLPAGSDATVTNTGTSGVAVFDFGLPRGADGNGAGDMTKFVYDTNNNGIVDNAEKVNGLTVLTAVPSGAKFTDTTYSAVTTTENGLMTSTDKNKLDGIDAGAKKPGYASITIAVSATANTDSLKDDYPYYQDVTVAGVTAGCLAEINPISASYAVASACMDGTNDTMAGKIRIYLTATPTAAITATATWVLVGG